MIVDLHAHYPMHSDPGLRGSFWRLLWTRRGNLRIRDYFRAFGVHLASLFGNYPTLFSGPRVRVPYMVEGQVGVRSRCLTRSSTSSSATRRRERTTSG